MKKVPLLLLLFLFLPTMTSADEGRLRQVIREADTEPMPLWKLSPLRKEELQPGLRLWVLDDMRLPTVQLHLLIPYGGANDVREGKVGRNILLAKAWRYGGTELRSPQAFSQTLERYAIDLDVKVLQEFTMVSVKCLSKDLKQALVLLEDWLFHPRFDDDRFRWAKRQIEAELEQIKDYHEEIAAYLYPELVYGKGSPWGERVTPKDIEAIGRSDIEAAYRDLIGSGPLLVGVVGHAPGIDRRLARVWKERTLPKQAKALPPLMTEKTWMPGVTLFHKEGDQSTILLGHLGERRFSKDKFALLVADFVLGGETFTSLLGADLRVKKGLVYGVGSSFGFETEYGLFKIYAKTKAKDTAFVLAAIQDKIRAIGHAGAVTETDLRLAKNAFLSNLLTSNEEKGKLMETLMRFQFYGYPPDYLEQFGQEIEKVTLADIERVARDYFFPDRLVVVVVGPPEVQSLLMGPWTPTRILSILDFFHYRR